MSPKSICRKNSDHILERKKRATINHFSRVRKVAEENVVIFSSTS
jgi:hypothetical protein